MRGVRSQKEEGSNHCEKERLAVALYLKSRALAKSCGFHTGPGDLSLNR